MSSLGAPQPSNEASRTDPLPLLGARPRIREGNPPNAEENHQPSQPASASNPGAIVVSASLSQCVPEAVIRTGKSDRAVGLLLPHAARVASAAVVQFLAAGVGVRLMRSRLRRLELMAAS